VRNLFAAVGLTVNRLIRIRYGCVVLPRGLKRGVWVDLPDRDVRTLRSLLGMRADGGQQPREGRPDHNKNNRRRDRRGRPERAPDTRTPDNRAPDNRASSPDSDFNEFASIPNPLQQTFDRRAIREARQPRREIPEDGPIPNPLEQTYDKRFVQKPRSLVGGRKGGGEGSTKQPDPMQTSVGYIGADAFHRKMSGGGGGGGGRRGGGGGGRGRR
jgi:23S rRNA pseudouridine2605 synthase